MKNLILTFAIAFSALFFTAVEPAQAGLCCKKKKVSTTEVCRRYYDVEKCAIGCGCRRIVTYAEITYCTTYRDCCGKHSTKTWKDTKKIKSRRCCSN